MNYGPGCGCGQHFHMNNPATVGICIMNGVNILDVQWNFTTINGIKYKPLKLTKLFKIRESMVLVMLVVVAIVSEDRIRLKKKTSRDC